MCLCGTAGAQGDRNGTPAFLVGGMCSTSCFGGLHRGDLHLGRDRSSAGEAMTDVIIDEDAFRRALAEFKAKRFHDGMVMLGSERCTRCWGTSFRMNDEKTPNDGNGPAFNGSTEPSYVKCECFEGWVVPTTGVETTIVDANVADPPDYKEEAELWGDPGHCPECGQAWENVRPGKSQPTCQCAEKCPCGGRIKYHSPEDSPNPRVSGYFCDKCGPFGEAK